MCFSLEFNRRAYAVGLYYDSSEKKAGIQFKVNNFDYSGINKIF